MQGILHLISKIHQKCNKFIIEQLKKKNIEGLVPSHGDILVVLYKNKMTMNEIAKKIRRTKPTVTVLVDKLEKSGYIKREASDKDNRCINIVLTKKGEDFKPIFEEISDSINNELFANLNEFEKDILEKLLKKIK